MIDSEVFDDPKFKEWFWNWFDDLPPSQRQKFQNYPADMAELHFYNKIYRHSSRTEAK